MSQEAVFELVYNAATCFIPTYELTEEQLDKLDRIMYHRCRCQDCRKLQRQFLGHADKKRLEINLSKAFFIALLAQTSSMGAALFQAVGTVLHEIIHILFPEYDEEQTRLKTHEWLKRNRWLEAYQEIERLLKSELTEFGYSSKK